MGNRAGFSEIRELVGQASFGAGSIHSLASHPSELIGPESSTQISNRGPFDPRRQRRGIDLLPPTDGIGQGLTISISLTAAVLISAALRP